MYKKITGTVKNKAGAPLIRKVYLLNRNTADKIAETTSASDGTYEFKTGDLPPSLVLMVTEASDNSNSYVKDWVVPGDDYVPVNTNIGVPGGPGFGVSSCNSLPIGFSHMTGSDDPYHENYGNYTYTDGSIMVWIPKFYYKWGTGSNGLGLNECDIRGTNYYLDEAAANLDGYALHRAFIDGGVIKDGFFIDKFLCSKHPTLNVPSSLRMSIPLASNTSYAQFGYPNQNQSAINIAKLRGTGFHITSGFMWNALALLSYAHGRASFDTTNCAWYGTLNNFPRANDVNSSAQATCSFDNTVLALKSENYAYSWSSNNNAKFTHNGQLNGVTDYGNSWDGCLGMTVIGTTFYYLKESMAMKDLVIGTGPNGVADVSTYDNIGATLSDYSTTAGFIYGIPGSQTFNEQVDRNSVEYKYTNLGIMKAGGWSTVNPKYYSGGTYRARPANLILACGGSYNSTGSAGCFGLMFFGTWADSFPNFGFRAAFYQ